MSSPRRPFELPSRAVLWAGAMLGLLVAAAVALLAVYEYGNAFAQEQARGALMARVLEDQATRTVETASIAMLSVSDLLAAQAIGDATEPGPGFDQALPRSPTQGLDVFDVIRPQSRWASAVTPGDARQGSMRPREVAAEGAGMALPTSAGHHAGHGATPRSRFHSAVNAPTTRAPGGS